MSDEFVIDVSSGFAQLLIKDGGLRSKLRDGSKHVLDVAYTVAQQMAPECENYMKQNAPWQDQTGAARSGLHAQAFSEGDSVGIVLYGSVPYQIYLETRFSGAFAIIQPTIDVMGPIVMSRFSRMLDRS